MFHRDFMEYHKHRFDDHSLLVFKKDQLVALLPANKADDTLFSHQGLTYGGLIVNSEATFQDVCEAFKQALIFLENSGINELQIKLLPSIYSQAPSSEIEYLLFKCKAELIRCDVLSVIDNTNKISVQSSNRKRGLKKALKHHLSIKEEDQFDSFWNNILVPNLERYHNATPVHTVKEITYLKSLFSKNIRQFNVYHNEKLVAGTTIFETKEVAHVQYISANENRQKLGSLDLLFHELIEKVFLEKKYFDFGISNEKQGQIINEGLLSWKESFGARSVTQNFYTVKTRNHKHLNNFMV